MPSSREAMIGDFSDFHRDLRRVLEAAQDVSLWPIYDRERNDCWSGGRIVLLGDACHPMRPFMAAGGAMAVEDGADPQPVPEYVRRTGAGVSMVRDDAYSAGGECSAHFH